MAIPPFSEEGLLPPGIHHATLEEVMERFGSSTATRSAIAESLGWAIDAARRMGTLRFIIDGSFVDDKPEPNDVDCVLLLAPDYPCDPAAARVIEEGIPFVQSILFRENDDLEEFLRLEFMTDRKGRPRGLVELQL